MADPILTWAVLIAGSFLPPILWVVIVRNTERFGREPAGQVARAFLWGAVIAVIVAVVLSLLFLYLLSEVAPIETFLGEQGFTDPSLILGAIIIAPFVEEFAKALGVLRVRRSIVQVEDGLVYGASAGLGFAATENLLYGFAALAASGSLGTSLLVIGIRSISSALLHGTATAATGYGIAKKALWNESAIPWYLLAVLMHAAFNTLASFGVLMTGFLGEWAALIGLVGAIIFALFAWRLMRAKIRAHDVGERRRHGAH
jgi:RsiW-degrading membrane proteinase PrsW (M82 family)